MWSRSFLITGLGSGALAAAFALLAIYVSVLAGGVAFDGGLLGHFAAFGVVGVLIYPACWAVVINRARDYSIRRTLYLVAITYGVCCLAVLSVLFVGFAYQAATIVPAAMARPGGGNIAMWFALTPVLVVFYALIFAAALAVPYAALATPVALGHRWFLLRTFAPTPVTPIVAPAE
jgi:hypothetical protein